MKTLSIILTFLLLLTFTSSVAAQTAIHGSSVVLPKGQIVNETYFAGGESVTISGQINGDAYIAGGTLYVDGVINGDLLFAGGTANINGTVTGDIRGAGGQINVSGTVGGNVTLAGGSVNIAQNAVIEKGLVGAGGQVNITAPLGKGAVVAGGQVTLSNRINGNVLAATENLVLTPNATISGNLNYYSEKVATIGQGASVAGTIAYHKQDMKRYKPQVKEQVKEVQKQSGSFGMILTLYSAIVSFILGSLFIKIAPRFMEKTTERIDRHMFSTMGIGLLILMFTPFLAVILLATIVGIPLGLIVFALYGISLYVSGIFVALYTGKKIFAWLKMKQGSYIQLLTGLFILMILTNIPLLGWLIKFIVVILGMGALLITKKTFYSSLKAEDML